MNLAMDTSLAVGYKSNSQKARRMTEGWVEREIFCPRCGRLTLEKLPNNYPVGDFICPKCKGYFELKSKASRWYNIVNDGAYETLIKRIESDTNPDWFFLSYDKRKNTVRQLFIVPKQFFTPSIVIKRKPLGPKSKRAGWVGAKLTLKQVPIQGRISIVDNGRPVGEKHVLANMKAAGLLSVSNIEARGWLLDVLNCVNEIESDEFKLQEMYDRFEGRLQALHPENHHIRDKIRQQLQELRDRGVIEFVKRGHYRKIRP